MNEKNTPTSSCCFGGSTTWMGILLSVGGLLVACASPAPTATPDIQATVDAAIAATATAQAPTATPSPTAKPVLLPTVSPLLVPTSTPAPTATATPTPTFTPTSTPTATPTVTATPTRTPTPTPTPIPRGQFYYSDADGSWHELTALMEQYPHTTFENSRFYGASLKLHDAYTLDIECTFDEDIYHYHVESTGNVYPTQACFDKHQSLCGENYTPEILPSEPGCFSEGTSESKFIQVLSFDSQLLDAPWMAKDVLRRRRAEHFGG